MNPLRRHKQKRRARLRKLLRQSLAGLDEMFADLAVIDPDGQMPPEAVDRITAMVERMPKGLQRL